MKPADLIVNGEIVLEGDVVPSGFEDYFDGGIITANLFRRALAMVDGDVVVRVNSAGGDPTEGEAIRAAIADHGAPVTVKVAGDAMSAASLMIMAADTIEMSPGSIMMIHDPSALTLGTSEDHRKSADVLDILADTYAGVYARRSGKSAAEMRTLMKSELYMGPAEAIAQGFADAISGDADDDDRDPAPELAAAEMSAARTRHAASITMVKRALVQHRPHNNSNPTAAGGHHQAVMAATQEATMPDPAKPAQASPKPETSPAVQMAAPNAPAPEAVQSAVMAERARATDIRKMAAPFMASGQLSQDDVDAVIADGTSADAAGQRFLAVMAAAQPPVRHNARTEITRDENETRMEGMIAALAGQTDGPAEQYRGLRLKSLAMELSGPRRGYNEADAVRRGMMSTTMMGGAHGVSDFSYITTEVMNRNLIAAYDRRMATWSAVTGAPVTASDFRELAPVRFGGDFQLKKVLENGEYHEASLADEAEGLKVERRGRTISLTFEAIVNDDMGAFARIPSEFAMAARIMESSMVWSLIRSNAVLKSDGLALFHATHKNLAASGAALSATTVGAARKALWEMTAFKSKDPDDFLMIEPDRLLIPPALELAAGQFIAAVTPAKDSDANPFKSSLTPVTVPHLGTAAGGSDTAWYLVSSDLPPIIHAYLDGYQSPTVQTIEGMNPDKVTMNARHIFGAAVGDYRGAYKNPGA